MVAPGDGRQVARARVERGVYRQPNGKYAVCFMLGGKPRFRTADGDLDDARSARARLAIVAQAGLLPVGPRLTFAGVAGRWIERFEAIVAVGERRERTLESHHLDRHLLPTLGRRQIAAITVDDVARLISALSVQGRAPRTIVGALATLGSILRFALRRCYITENPMLRLEAGERPRPDPRPQRALGQDEIARLLAACAPRYRLMIVTALYTWIRISEVLALTWDDVDFAGGVIHVRRPAGRAAPQRALRWPRRLPLRPGSGTPLGHRNVERRALQRASASARIVPAPRFHDLRHTFASHLIIDLGLDVAQVSRILGHASVATTLNVYTHLFDDARQVTEIRTRMASSAFARLLEPHGAEADNVVVIARRPPVSARTGGGALSAHALDRDLTTPPRRSQWAVCARRTGPFAGASMELGGLEPRPPGCDLALNLVYLRGFSRRWRPGPGRHFG